MKPKAGARLYGSAARSGLWCMGSVVAEQLRSSNQQTRAAALATLEAAPPGAVCTDHDALVALGELRTLDVEEVPREMFERVSLLLGRLALETTDDRPHSVLAAVWGAGRYVALCDVREATASPSCISTSGHTFTHTTAAVVDVIAAARPNITRWRRRCARTRRARPLWAARRAQG